MFVGLCRYLCFCLCPILVGFLVQRQNAFSIIMTNQLQHYFNENEIARETKMKIKLKTYLAHYWAA